MRLAAAAACWIVAWDCAEKADAIQVQHMFVSDALWLWWIPTVIWTISGFKVIMAGVE